MMNSQDTVDVPESFASALKFGVGLQLSLLVLTALVLDGGQLGRQFMVALIGYWLGLGFITIRRKTAPSTADLFLIRYGSLALLPLAPVIAKLVYLIIGEST